MKWDEPGRVGGRDKIVRDSDWGPWERATTRHSSTLMPMPEGGNKKVGDVTRSFVKHSNVTLPGPGGFGGASRLLECLLRNTRRLFKFATDGLKCILIVYLMLRRTTGNRVAVRHRIIPTRLMSNRSSPDTLRRVLDPGARVSRTTTRNIAVVLSCRCHRILDTSLRYIIAYCYSNSTINIGIKFIVIYMLH